MWSQNALNSDVCFNCHSGADFHASCSAIVNSSIFCPSCLDPHVLQNVILNFKKKKILYFCFRRGSHNCLLEQYNRPLKMDKRLPGELLSPVDYCRLRFPEIPYVWTDAVSIALDAFGNNQKLVLLNTLNVPNSAYRGFIKAILRFLYATTTGPVHTLRARHADFSLSEQPAVLI